MITGEKIVLRPYRIEDAEAIYAGAMNPTMRRLTGTQMTFTLEQTRAYVERVQTADDRAAWIIAHPETLAPLGEVVIMDIDDTNRSAHLRIGMFHEEHLNKGYGTEAMRLAVDYGFTHLHLHRIELNVFEFNDRAIRVYEKIGFKREGVLRDVLLYEGEFHSAIIMSILEGEWQNGDNNNS
jgi:RimJ/RimL family protein N-acetyltransferase